MQVELGNAKELAQLVKVGVALSQELQKDGTLKQIYDGITSARKQFRTDSARLDVEQYEYYTANGISPEHAILLIIASKGAWKPDFSKVFSKK